MTLEIKPLKNNFRTEKIPEQKVKRLQELTELLENKKTILIASIKNLPASQFQEIGKMLRKVAIVKVPKKNLIYKAIDNSKKISKKEDLKEQIKDSTAILFSDLDSFDLALDLIKNKSPAKAKTGQEAPMDIEIQEGPTDLVPGPAISELGALGIQIKIEGGKINIKKSKIIVKSGEKISQAAADIMSKLDIKPFSIGFIPLSSFDTQENKLYLEIKIDKEKTIEELKTSFSKAIGFMIDIEYICKDTIKFLIGKAAIHEKVLKNLTEKPSENKGEEKVESDVQETKSEDKEDEKKEDTQETKSNSEEN